MGFGDKFKNIAKQAQEAVVEHKDQIHQAVESVGGAADRKTKGKYTDKIAKFGQKTGDALDKLAGEEGKAPAGPAATQPAQPPEQPAARPPDDPEAAHPQETPPIERES